MFREIFESNEDDQKIMKFVKKILNSKAFTGQGTIYPGKGGVIYFRLEDAKSAMKLNRMMDKAFDYMDDYPLQEYGGGGSDYVINGNYFNIEGKEGGYLKMEWKNSFAIPEEITSLLKKKGFEVR